MKEIFITCFCITILITALSYMFWDQRETGRYTIVLQERYDYSGKHNDDHVLLLDTKTGTIRTYYSKTSYEPKKWYKEEFGD